MEINEKLTRIIRGRSIELVTQEEGLVTIVFGDYSTMRVKVAGGPTMNMLDEGILKSVLNPSRDCGPFSLRRNQPSRKLLSKIKSLHHPIHPALDPKPPLSRAIRL